MLTLEFLRQLRLGGYAIFDLSLAFLGILLLSSLLSKLFLKIGLYFPKFSWVFLTLPLGIFIHLIFGNMTPMTKDFFSWPEHFWLKIIILTSLFFGLKGVRIIRDKSKK
jgi:hypothetical protein